jgi:hypothetical protein
VLEREGLFFSEGRTFEDSTIKERYESESGEEWKERLSCKVDGRMDDAAGDPARPPDIALAPAPAAPPKLNGVLEREERYESESGEEWKERLSCKVDGREYVQGQEKKNNPSNVRPSETVTGCSS